MLVLALSQEQHREYLLCQSHGWETGKQRQRSRGATLRLINMQRALGQVSLLPFYATIWATCRRVGSMMCCCCLCYWQGFNNVSIIVGTDSHWQLKKLTKLLDWVIGNKLGNQQKKRQPGLYAAEWQVISFQHTHTPTSAVHQQLVSQATKTPVASNRHRASWLYLPPPLTESSWPNTMHAEQYIALAKVLATLYANRERETGSGKQGGEERAVEHASSC